MKFYKQCKNIVQEAIALVKKDNKKVVNKKNNDVNKQRKHKVFNTILLILIVIAITSILYTVIKLIINPTDITIVEEGVVSAEESSIGYVIRDEKIVKGNNYQNGIVQIKTEGEKIAKGEAIFRYSGSNEESLSNKINESDFLRFHRIPHT